MTADDGRLTMGLRCDEVVEYWYERHPWTETNHAVYDVNDRIQSAGCSACAGSTDQVHASSVQSTAEAYSGPASFSNHSRIRFPRPVSVARMTVTSRGP